MAVRQPSPVAHTRQREQSRRLQASTSSACAALPLRRVLLPLLLCLACAAPSCAAPVRSPLPYIGFQGELQILVISDSPTLDHERLYVLVVSETVKYMLNMSGLTGLPPLMSGMTVLALGPFNTASNQVEVKSLTVIRAPAMAPLLPGQVTNISSVVFLVNICGRRLNLNAGVMRASWTNGNGMPLYGRTMQQYHEQCSFGKVSFTSDNNIVLGPITVPCTGTGSLGPWDSNFCRSQELFGWTEAAIAAAKSQGLVTSTWLQRARLRRVMIIPDMPQCAWAGLGSVGCGSNCLAFTSESYALKLDTLFHELGHNAGLLHSTTPGDEYGDCSCAMGGCYTYRCYNAPQSWRLGWYTAIAKVDSTNLTRTGRWLTYELPPTQDAEANHVIVRPGWATAMGATSGYFISYRDAVGGDSGLDMFYRQRVSVHLMDNVLSPEVIIKPVLVSTLEPGTEFMYMPALVKIRFVSRSGATARVAICRFNVPADCTFGVTTSPSPPSPLPSPPRPSSPPASPQSPPAPPPPGCGAPPGPQCGDGICDAWAGENCRVCPQDCSGKLTGIVQWCCGANTRTNCSATQCGGPNLCRESCPGVASPPPRPRPLEQESPPLPPNAQLPPPPASRAVYTPPPPGQGCASFPNPRCGDGICDAWAGESCRSCPQDCPGDLQGWTQFCCGFATKTGCESAKCGDTSRCRLACPA